MTDREDALTLAGYILAHPKHADIAAPIRAVIDRILNPLMETRIEIRSAAPPAAPPIIAETTVREAEPTPTVPPAKTDEQKIAEYMAANPVVKVKRQHNMSPEARAAAAQRMRDMQARKKAEKERVTITVNGKPLSDPYFESEEREPGEAHAPFTKSMNGAA